MSRRGIRGLVILAVTAAVVIGLAFAAHSLWTVAKRHFTSDACTVAGYEVDPTQAAVASTIVGTVTSYQRALPERASVLVLAAALQESKLRNIAPGDGDRDSVGVLQQRPSQGWGSVSGQPDTIADRTKRLTDVREATKEFLDALVKVDGWQAMELADAVQAVQISADGSAYAQHEGEAQALADALEGRTPAGISCSFAEPSEVAKPGVVAAQARLQLGIDTPVAAGRTVRVPGAHWQTASWFVANADRLGIEHVAYAGQRWTRSKDWQQSPSAANTVVIATMHQT